MKVNLIQDLATPHNNVLIEAFKKQNNIELKLWYAEYEDMSRYQWKKNLTDEHYISEIYGTKFNLRFLVDCLKRKDEKFIIVGWMNINTLLLHILFFILRRPYNHWTDAPNPHSVKFNTFKRIKRNIAYFVLKNSNCKIFCVGNNTINYFLKQGFFTSQLINLPIFVKTNDNLDIYYKRKTSLYEKFNFDESTFLISTGSRLIYEKGFDLLIFSISLLKDKNFFHKIKLIIVGSGSELEKLKKMVIQYNLENIIFFESWLSIDDFKTLIANSHLFIQPSRFDAYGATTLAMSLGTTVLGTYESGAAFDRIIDGENGFLYHAEDTIILASKIEHLILNNEQRKKMGISAYETSMKWPPEKGVEIILFNIV
jgi:glycosyltransferase involved in cell wall biosynthesis